MLISPVTGARGENLPKPGDLYIAPETSRLGVEWAVIDVDPTSGQLYAVPADTCRLVGSQDVAVMEGSSGGPLSLRCGLGLWLPRERFDTELRSGALDAEDLSRARRAWQSILSGDLVATPPQEETDSTFEYQVWVGQGPVRARGLLAQEPNPSRDAQSFDPAAAAPRQRSWTWSGSWRPLALAFSLLLAVSLAAAGGWLARGPAEHGKSTVRSMTNVHVVTPHRVRGAQKVLVPPEAEALLLRIPDPSPSSSSDYRFELRNLHLGENVLALEGLRRLGDARHLALILPASQVPSGNYSLLLSRSHNGEPERVADYRLEIEYRDHDTSP